MSGAGFRPVPLVAAEVDLRGLGGFMLRTDRLLSSELVALCTPEEGWAALMLWTRAWQQQPAASLPNDERVLASFSKAGRRWPKVRDMAMRGFVLCSDNRWYHRVLAEEALEAWSRRLKFRERSDKANKAKKSHQQGNLLDGQQGVLEGDEVKGSEGKVKGPDRTATVTSLRSETSANSTSAAGAAEAGVQVWTEYATAYERRYGVPPERNAKVNGQIAQLVKRIPATDAPAVAAFFVEHNLAKYVRALHPVGMLLQDAEALCTQWKTGNKVTDTTARQADRSSATLDNVNALLAEASRSR